MDSKIWVSFVFPSTGWRKLERLSSEKVVTDETQEFSNQFCRRIQLITPRIRTEIRKI